MPDQANDPKVEATTLTRLWMDSTKLATLKNQALANHEEAAKVPRELQTSAPKLDGLAFRNFKLVADAHSVTYDKIKAAQQGTRCFAKHIYANPEDWLMCQWTGLALHCALQKEVFGANKNGFIYFKEGTKDGSAAKTYQEALHGIVNQSQERVKAARQHCRVGHFNAFGLRKGAASHNHATTIHERCSSRRLVHGAGFRHLLETSCNWGSLLGPNPCWKGPKQTNYHHTGTSQTP